MKVKVGVLIILLLTLFWMVGELGAESAQDEVASDITADAKLEDKDTPRKPVVTKTGHLMEETVHFQNGQAITIVNSGGVYSDMYDRTIMYFDFMVENEGNEASSIYSSTFSVYADNQAVEILIESDSFSATFLDPGRSVSGRIYADVDPAIVGDIEVQVGDAIWVIQGFGSATEIKVNGVLIEIPSELYYSKGWLDNSGIFENTSGTSTIDLQFYDEADDSVLGKMKVSDGANGWNLEGEFVLLLQNVYYLVHDGHEQVLVSFYEHNMNDSYYTEGQLFVDGVCIDFYYRPQE